MELPNHCKHCRQASDDCVLLFRASKMRQIRKKRFILKKCPCNECIVVPVCDKVCELLSKYINVKIPHTSQLFLLEYFHCKPINWFTRKGI